MSEAKRAAEKVLKFLNGRGGFDAWWEDIDRRTQREITEGLAELLVPESAQPAERAGEWVSVEERLPEHAQSVLFWGKGWVKGAVFGLGRFMTDEDGRRLFEDETQQEDDGPRMYPTDEVTHWMPLPPPPQPKEKP